MKFRDLLILMAAAFAAGYFLHEPAPKREHEETSYSVTQVEAVNQLAVTPVNLLQRQAAAYNEVYGLTGEPDGEPRDIFAEKR
jgi:hypothetical protein